MSSTPRPDLHAWLQAHPTPTDASLTLTHDEVRALQQELARLQQSAEFLRKQNRKLRGRVAKLRGDPAEGGDDALADD
ncbi:MAG: hypothetical protein IPM29_09795 [Planctomycetes bacterium]|nr:hypothetical protein [Planctomycetota bacterium]